MADNKARYGRALVPFQEVQLSGIVIYRNPKCTKSRQTLSLLQGRGIQPTIIEYLNTPPDAATLDQILGLLGREPRDLIRSKKTIYKEVGADDAKLDRLALIDIMVANPILIERPIVLANGKAAVGRPPEEVLAII
jgi:arsenate reductase